ncbi:general stress protein [Arthrobacter sp. ISL-5]|uniref:general stress protein n=1 Tax=Arthrobacter sp. ISL-5 TaxID=2819111 RepID=UPI001BEC54E7|nr:general stress protein [Arthrobacter sp. ISL-5]MBT2554351.1 ECF transporter S component [Arthrobacter sp. ISL-5]
MSNIFGGPKAGVPNGSDESRTVPTGDTVGTYTSYLDAQKAVDYLADQQFPVHMVSIVGNDLKMVERVTGRLSYPRVALSGALSGMWFGLFVGVMLSFFTPAGGTFSIISSVLMGAAFFMLFGIVTYATQRGKRDFTSTSQVVATNYDVVVSFEAAHEARRLLQQLPMSPSDASGGARPATYTQRDYQGQPYQQQPGQHPGQQGQAPQRPAGWNDPYGQRAQDAQGQDAQGSQTQGSQTQGPQVPGAPVAGAPQYGVVDGQPGQTPDGQTPDAGQRAGQRPAAVRYPDLPDGRPQYGVRVSDPSQVPQRKDDEQH